jgi:solute:Na+ symporter, SSS family
MLITIVVIYLLLSIGIGLYAARRVHSSKDYMVAGRSLPLYISLATVFATWFGAETVLSVSATFTRDGLGGIVADPFGASACLLLVALFFARSFYRMNLLTIGDFYRKRYNKPVEVVTSLAIGLSYLGWTSAQLTALGLVLMVLSDGAISLSLGIVIGTVVVVGYTIWGGMWSVALTDLFQTVVIIVGLIAVALLMADMAGGAGVVVQAAIDADKFRFWPDGGLAEWLPFVAAFLTLALGSIPQQDVFQRVTSAKDETTAVRAALLGAVLYFCLAFVPIFIAFAALTVDPSMAKLFESDDAREIQRILPDAVLAQTPLWAQAMFFGALLSAILSTASGALLAPAAIFSENVIKPFVKHMSDRQLLLTVRLVLIIFSMGALLFAINSRSTMYEMVQNAYKVTLVTAFVPLVFGLYWRRATNGGAVMAIVLGAGSWIAMELFGSDTMWPPQLVGLAFALFGMIVGSLMTQSREHHMAPALESDPPR